MSTAPRILVVEDEMIVAEDLVESLRSLGYRICGTVSSGEDAFKVAMQEAPDLILMDIMLRDEIDGIEAAKLIRSRVDVPIIFLTSYTDSAVLNRAKLSEPFGYLTKPFAETELHASIQMALHRAHMERQLKESEARLRTLLKAIPDAVVVYDANGKATFVNEGFERMYGWSGQDLTGIGPNFVPPEESEATAKTWEQLFRGEIVEFETKRATKAGNLLDIQLRASALRNGEGNILESIVVHRDITRRKMAERILRDAQRQLEERVRERTAELLQRTEELKEEVRQRRLAEEAALREKENLERVFEAMEDGVLLVDQQYNIQYVNRSLERDMGPVRGRACYEYFHDRTEPCRKCHMHKLFERTSVRQEWFSFKSGKTYELLDTVLKNPDESLSKLEIFRDITKRKKAQQALSESEKRYRELIENASDIVFQTNGDGHVTFANVAAQKMMGYSEREFIGKHYLELVHPSHRKEAEAFYAAQVERKLPDTYYEFPLRTKTGETLWLGQKVQLLTDGDETVGLQAFTRDITERIQAERALRESEERFRELADLLPQFVYETNRGGYFAFLNKAGLDAIGCTWDDIRRGIKGVDVFAIEDRNKVARNFEEIMHGRQTLGNEYRLQRPNGSQVPVITYSTPIVREDKVVGVRGVAIDISHLKKMEAQLRHAQKMEAVGTLAGGIAHDFNNLLSPILMGAEMALDEVEQGSEVSHYLNEIRIAADRAADLVSQILVFSRFTEPQTKTIRLGPVIEESIRFLRATLPATIAVRCTIETDLDTIEGDPAQIQQVVMNLGTNAAHAMGPDGGLLEMNLESVTPGSAACDGNAAVRPSHVRLTVRDSGCGMSPEVQERVFEPYFTTKAVGEGSGLGLAMVHGIVERHRGTIKIDSKPGEGSCFSVYFPLVETVPVDNGIAREGIRRGNERILLVDDEPGIVAMSCKMLAAMGYHVTAAANGSEAIERFQEEPHNFDLVITDMIMPDMTGNKLAQLILTIRPDVPVVLTTGYMDQSTLKEAEEMGICSVVLKPFGKKQMSDAIKKALDSPKED